MSRVKKIPDRDIFPESEIYCPESEDLESEVQSLSDSEDLEGPFAVRSANEDFPNFEEILRKRVEEHKKQENEEEREKVFEIDRKEFRKSNFEKVIQGCIDYVVGTAGIITSNDVYTTVIVLNEGNLKRFFTIEDIKEILGGLVRNNLLKYEHSSGYIYAPLLSARTLSEMVEKKYEEMEIEKVNMKNARKFEIKEVIKYCIDYFYPCRNGTIVKQIENITSDNVYQTIMKSDRNIERFFTKKDIEDILEGLVQINFLKHEWRDYTYCNKVSHYTRTIIDPHYTYSCVPHYF